jgi:hypothetical protein
MYEDKKTCQLPSYLKLRFIPKKLMILSVMEGYTFAESINVYMNRIERKYFNSMFKLTIVRQKATSLTHL